jgi:hypothetical protein
MKRMTAVAVVVLCLAAGAQATPVVYAEVTYPSSTTWSLWLTETTNWDGNPADMTPGGFGIAGFSINLPGGRTGIKGTPSQVSLETTDDPSVQVGTVGFPVGPGIALLFSGIVQAFGGQDNTVPDEIFYGFGVTAGSYTVPDANRYQTSSPYSWAAPGAPGSASPGVLVFRGTRNSGQTVSIEYDFNATVFTGAMTGFNTPAVETVNLVPEPGALFLLTMGGLSAFRRRR